VGRFLAYCCCIAGLSAVDRQAAWSWTLHAVEAAITRSLTQPTLIVVLVVVNVVDVVTLCCHNVLSVYITCGRRHHLLFIRVCFICLRFALDQR